MSLHRNRGIRAVGLVGLGTVCLGFVVACGGGGGGNQSMSSASNTIFVDKALVSNKAEVIAASVL